MVESLLLAVTRITTMMREKQLSCSTGFQFRRDERLYLVTNRHVVRDEPNNHQPDRLLIDLHPDPKNLAETSQFELPLYDGAAWRWIRAVDSTSEVDIVAIQIDTTKFPADAAYTCFTREHVSGNFERVEIGAELLIPGFPLGFHDEPHHLPVARHRVVASSFGLRCWACIAPAFTSVGMSKPTRLWGSVPPGTPMLF
ncbi:hypothetical protein [Rubinisphaera margarita]|uniref:hypothetical protein n=1 Tax=Rubinisphaera margarita TaxID=2909586 RepID=UPI001EE955B4|nr:hypothetical protein [Rubinisphaera margarita]MCG6155438.1 hypothetical protein [Rubinisphaera margarita]